ncbi:MAG: hypothetical protein LBI01_01715 [Elusimicrobium sp.]|jgi:hypothetical protein|nr:hypothetical protein [Elusimicrobium sp.]
MPTPTLSWLKLIFKRTPIIFLTVLYILLINAVRVCAQEEEFFLFAVTAQGVKSEELVSAYKAEGKFFLSLSEFFNALNVDIQVYDNYAKGWFLDKNRKIEIDFVHAAAFADNEKIALDKSDFFTVDNNIYVSSELMERLLPVTIEPDELQMQLLVTSKEKLPIKIKEDAALNRTSLSYGPENDGFEKYIFDGRFFSAPVVDIAYTKGFYSRNFNDGKRQLNYSDGYNADAAMIFAGMDTHVSLFGDSQVNDGAPRARVIMGRTFLEEPKNKINLTQTYAGDVYGFSNTLFTKTQSGRGIYLSSFKDLVTSADRTINISGPLPAGWEVELYKNGMLIEFRQGPVSGRYQFGNIPVVYGLNVFNLVFYGPYGEIRKEERRFYSGVSPVGKGEAGYTAAAYQANRYVFENNEPLVYKDNNAVTGDGRVYYGLSDYTSISAGYTYAPDPENNGIQKNYASLGIMTDLSGASLEYVAGYDAEGNMGHLATLQGNVYIGDIFSQYNYYGNIRSGASFEGVGKYKKDTWETRFSGIIPAGFIGLPYYVSYEKINFQQSIDEAQRAIIRISPNFMRYYNITVENRWTQNIYSENAAQNDVNVAASIQGRYFGVSANASCVTMPGNYINTAGANLGYRYNKNTYFQLAWLHNYLKYSNYKIDTVTLNANRMFFFGGLRLAAGYDSFHNFNSSLTYNISFGKVPDRSAIFTNADTKLTQSGSVFLRMKDETDKPVKGVKVISSGSAEPVRVSDERGEVLITDFLSYQKTRFMIDISSIEDVSFYPDKEIFNYVLRPGALRIVDVLFRHKGSMEGKVLLKRDNVSGFQINIVDKNGNTAAKVYTDGAGSFFTDEINFGFYDLTVSDNKGRIIARKNNIELNKNFLEIIVK